MKKVLTLLFSVGLCLSAFAQTQDPVELTIELQYDTVGLQEQFQVKYILKNARSASFEQPDFSEFHLIAGPMQSSQFSMVNGVTSSSVSQTYVLQASDVGAYILPAITVNVNGEKMTSPDAAIVVVEETNHPQQPYNSMSPFGQSFRFENDNMDDLFKKQEELFKKHQDMFNDPQDLFKGFENILGGDFYQIFKNMEDAFDFKLPPAEKKKPENPVYKL